MNGKTLLPILILHALIVAWPGGAAEGARARIVRAGDAAFQERLATREIRRYLYLRTGELAEIALATDKSVAAEIIVVGIKGQRQFQPYLSDKDKTLGQRIGALNAQEYLIKTLEGGGRKITLIVGGDAVGALYGAYRFVEHLGVRFYLHGDVIPDARREGPLPELDEAGKPLFALRGLNPWGSHPFGFDRWGADDYRAIIGQLAKLRMNFIGMHCYLTKPYTEPTVWIGAGDQFDERGRVAAGYPARYYNTFWKGHWGPIPPKKTGDYGFGAALLFEDDAWAPEAMRDFCPTPSTPADRQALFDRVGGQFNAAFGFARLLGVKTCLGTEAPLKKFMPAEVRKQLEERGKNPDDPAVVGEVYRGIFERIKRTHPLDYYWVWTPEGWTWQGNSVDDMQETVDDVKTALSALKKAGAPFKLATSGWVLGPKDDRAAFDRMVPKEIAMSAISRQIGYTPVDPAFGEISGRQKWAIPWLESDDFLASPQLWVGRTRKDAADALAYQCDGLMGLHWRTRIVGPNAAALARAAWEQPWNPAPGQVSPISPTAKDEKAEEAALGGKMAKYPGREIAGTEEDVVYQTCRYDLRGYRLKIPNGQYRVTLKFCEPHFTAAGKRVCDVKLSGMTVLERFDIFAEVGQFAACDKSFSTTVKHNSLSIDIVYRESLPCISAIVLKGNNYTRKINCGGPDWRDYEADLPTPTNASIGRWKGGNVPRGLPIDDFYRDWALTLFGAEVAEPAAAIFGRIDGKVPQPLGGGCPSGSLRTDGRPWDQVAGDYAFVDELAVLRPRVAGAGNLERFDYWLNAFRYQRGLARVQCALGRFDAAMKQAEGENNPAASQKAARDSALPLYRKLVEEYGAVVRLRLQTVTTHGGIATVVNLQQHARFWPVAIDQPAQRLSAALGGALPGDVLPPKGYQGPVRIIVPTVRTSLLMGEALELKAIVLDRSPPESVELNWRPLGAGDFSKVAFTHINRGVYAATLSAKAIDGDDFEYFIETKTSAGAILRHPPTAPRLNSTVVTIAP